jgi:hypothetical protein
MIILNTVNDMKTKVIDIRKHDPEKVVAYWVSQGGRYVGFGKSQTNPFVGIDGRSMINSWSLLDDHLELIDLPEEEFKTGDRVVDSGVRQGTYIGYVDGKHYIKFDGFEWSSITEDATTLKHYKEPELFEGWVSQFCNVVFESWAQAHEACSDARVFKVREVKDED